MHKVNDLDKRYSTARSNIYVRLKKLGISPQRIGRNACISDEQLALMDRLDQFIKGGGTIPEFLVDEGMELQLPQVKDRILDCFRHLDEACLKGWLLGSSQLAALLNVPPSAIDQQNPQFADGGFLFRRQGERLSGETAWQVIKLGE